MISMAPIRGIYGICDTTFTPQKTHQEIAQGLLAGGVRIIQLRMKDTQDLDKVAQTARAILKLKQDYDFTFILNDYVELAHDLRVDGVHVGADDMALPQVRELVGNRCLIGYSSHSLKEGLDAAAAGADYVALGAIFPTATKGPGHPVVGLETLRELVAQSSKPVVAIGGIHQENYSEVLQTGVPAIAMISALVAQNDIKAAAQYFCQSYANYTKRAP